MILWTLRAPYRVKFIDYLYALGKSNSIKPVENAVKGAEKGGMGEKMAKVTTRGLLKFGANVSIIALASPAIAQDSSSSVPAEAAEEESISTIVVTATRDDRTLEEVPMQVDVADGDLLEDLSIFDVKDISLLSPGLELSNNDPRKNTTTLRGVSFDPDQGTSPAVEVYYNEIPIDAQVAYTAIYDIEQIEVLRGPQGLLRGLNSPAGALTIRTRRPNFDFVEGYATGTVTSRDGYNLQGGVSVPLSDTFAVRLSGLIDGNEANAVTNIVLDEESRNRTESVRATLGWRPTDDFTTYLTYQYLDSNLRQHQQVVGDGNTPFGIYSEVFGTPSIFVPVGFGGGPFAVDESVRSGPSAEAGDYIAVADGGSDISRETHLINLNAEYDFGAMTISFAGAYQQTDSLDSRDLDAGNAIPGYLQFDSTAATFRNRAAELRLASNDDEGFGWGVGAFYLRAGGSAPVVNTRNSNLFSYAVDPTTIVQSPLGPNGTFITVPNELPLTAIATVPITQETTSFNAYLRYFAGPLRIEGGVRYSIIDRSQQTLITTEGFIESGPIAGIPPELEDIRERPWTGGLNIGYSVTPDINVYAAFGTSFRAPSTGVATPAGISDDLVRSDSERTNSYEIGTKGTLLNGDLRFSIAAFYQEFDGFLSRFSNIFFDAPENPGGQNGFFDFNFNGDATVQGIEGSFSGSITSNWDIGLNLAYANARYDDATLPCNDFAGTGSPNQDGTPSVTGDGNVSFCVSDDRLAEVPDFNASGSTEVRIPLNDVTPYVSTLWTYRPGFFSELSQFDYRDRLNINLFAGVRSNDGDWTVTMFAKNLLNQKRITNISLGTQTIAATIDGAFDSGYRTVNVTTPREFGLTLSYNF